MGVFLPQLVQVNAPTQEPVTLAEVKLFLRIDHTDEDVLLDQLITTARRAAENVMRISLLSQEWKMIFHDYMSTCVQLRRAPVQDIVSVQMVSRDGAVTTVDASRYDVRAEYLVMDTCLVSHRVEVTYNAGYATVDDVPEEIKQGIMIHVAGMYERRLTGHVVGAEVNALYAPYKMRQL